MIQANKYEVKIKPLKNATTYETDYIDISDCVKIDGISDIIQQVDDGDFDIGIFTFGYVDLTLLNFVQGFQGKFSNYQNPRSIFKYTRDRCEVSITFFDLEGNSTAFFSGLIAEEYTREDIEKETISIRVLSRDSIFRKLVVKGGSIGSGILISKALEILLNQPQVTTYLNYNPVNINPVNDFIIDEGSPFDNISYIDAITKLMLASGSIMLVDDNFNIIVRSRTEDTNTPINFYNEGDLQGRTNIIKIQNYNDGSQRAFNLFSIAETSSRDDNYINIYGLRKKEIEVKSFITNIATRQQITDFYLNNFKVPKKEFEVMVKTNDAIDLKLLKRCTVSVLPLYKPADGVQGLPLYNQATFPFKYPIKLSNFRINGNILFKIIAITKDVRNLITVIKFREIGITPSDSIL